MVALRSWLAIGAVALLVGIGTVACSSDSGGSDTSPSEASSAAGAAVSATEKDFSIDLGTSSLSAGDVSFDIENQGPSTHEFVVVQTDLAPEDLPVKKGAVVEDSPELKPVDEVEDIADGSTETLNVTLDSGSYVVLCNLPGHYLQGMHTGLTVS